MNYIDYFLILFNPVWIEVSSLFLFLLYFLLLNLLVLDLSLSSSSSLTSFSSSSSSSFPPFLIDQPPLVHTFSAHGLRLSELNFNTDSNVLSDSHFRKKKFSLAVTLPQICHHVLYKMTKKKKNPNIFLSLAKILLEFVFSLL